MSAITSVKASGFSTTRIAILGRALLEQIHYADCYIELVYYLGEALDLTSLIRY